MHSLTRLQIRHQLYLLILLIALPAAGILVHHGFREQAEAVEEATAEAEKLAQSVTSEISLLVENARQTMMVLSHLPEVRSGDAPALNRILRDLSASYPYYTMIFVAGLDGVTWASSKPAGEQVPVGDRRYFKEAVTTGRFSAGEYAIGRASGLPTFSFGYPFRDGRGKIAGVVAIAINLTATKHLLPARKALKDVTFSIFDHRGTYLFRGTDNDSFIGRQDKPELFVRMRDGSDRGSFSATAGDGVNRLMAYRKLYLNGDRVPFMHIRAGIAYEKAVSIARREIFGYLVIYTPFVLASLLLGAIIVRRGVLGRVKILQEAGRRLAAGDLAYRVGERAGGGELGELARTFDEMAQSLNSRERELREHKELLQSVVESTSDAIFVKDMQGRYRLFNPGAEAMSGKRAEEIIGRDDTCLFPPEVAEKLMESDRAVLFRGESLVREDVVTDGKGQSRHVYIIKGPLRDTQGNVAGLFGIARDISERKRNEEKLRQAHDELERRVEERTDELLRTVTVLKQEVVDRKKAEEALRHETAERLQALELLRESERSMIQQSRQAAMGEMLSHIAHQWRQPLNTLGMQVQRLQLCSEMGTLSSELLATSTRDAMQLIRHMSQTIEDFSTFFKPDKVVVFGIREVLRQTVSLVDSSLQHQGIGIAVDVEGDPTACGCPNEFSQALLNLLFNSRDALVACSVEHGNIELRSFVEAGQSVVILADNAGGIPEEIIGRIFDPYFSTKGPQGTGIGLFMSKNIIEKNMSGRLTVCNSEQGAAFRIELPVPAAGDRG